MTSRATRFRTAACRVVLSSTFMPTCLLIAFALRLLWVYFFDANATSDFDWYFGRGFALAAGQGFTDSGVPTALNPPGYPLFLAVAFKVFGATLLVAKLVTVLLQMTTLFLAYTVARELFRSEFVGRVTFAVLAFHPNNIAYTSLPASEHLLVPLLLLAVLATVRASRRGLGWAMLAGVVWGAAVLTKPQALLAPLVLSLVLLAPMVRARAVRQWGLMVLVLHVGLALVVGPWVLRNQWVFGAPAFYHHGGIHLFIGNNRYATGEFMSYRDDPRLAALLPSEEAMFDASHPERREGIRNSAAQAVALRQIREHPGQFLRLIPAKIWRLYYADYDGAIWNRDNMKQAVLIKQQFLAAFSVISELYYLVIWAGFLAALVLLPRSRRLGRVQHRLPTIGLWVIIYFTAVYAVYFGDPIYHVPMLPWMVIFGAALLGAMVRTPGVAGPASDTPPAHVPHGGGGAKDMARAVGRAAQWVRPRLHGVILARWWVPVCLLVAAALRIVWAVHVHPEPYSDFGWYLGCAKEIAAGMGYTINGVPTAYFPPGYPTFLALVFKLFGTSLVAAWAASIVLQMGTLILAYYVSRQLFSSELVGRLTLLLLTLYPNHIAYSSLLASENLFIVLMLGATAVTLAARKQPLWALLAGLLWGAATLTRMQAVFFPAILLALWLLPSLRAGTWRRWALTFALAHLSLALVVGMWAYRNYRVFGHPLITTTGGLNLYLGNNPAANGNWVTSDEIARDLNMMGDEVGNDRFAGQKAKQYIREHPWHVVSLTPLKLKELYCFDDDGVNWSLMDQKNPPGQARTDFFMRYSAVCQRYYDLVWLAAILFFVVAIIRRRRGQTVMVPAFGLLAVGCLTALHLVYYGMTRYHAPMMPWIIMYAAALLALLLAPAAEPTPDAS